jgi:tetratricopeptide (TPR) repeat protein
MKRLARGVLMVLVVMLLAGSLPQPAEALTPYRTWALGPRGRLYLTQDAYIPFNEIELPINAAEDLYITPDGQIYIADTGNGRILRLQQDGLTAEFGKGLLEKPTGVFVDGEGVIYVADAGKNHVVILDADGNLINEFGRPSEPLFGRRAEFLPRKLVVDARKNIYIISEASVNGVVQMNTAGQFIGYFGANTAEMSLKMILQRLFLTREQLEQFIKNEAASPSNLAIDRRSLIYTVTAGTSPRKSIRKFTIAGKNIFPDTFGSSTFRDVHISEEGLLTAVDASGVIYEYVENGMLLFVFGAPDQGEQRRGTLRNPTGIARFGENLYVLDKEKNALVVFRTTAFARLVHEGVRRYVEGFYTEAKPYFEEVLNYNGSFIMTYQAIGDAYFKEGKYAEALTAYRYAEDRKGFSEAFWELRNAVLQRHLAQFLGVIVALGVVQGLGRRLDRRFGWLQPLRRVGGQLAAVRFVDDLRFLFRFIRQPADSFYYIKRNLRGSVPFALLLYGWVIAVRLLTLYWTGFVFNPYASANDVPVAREVITLLIAIGLWNIANYLISTITDGEGRFRDVFIGSAYSLFPYALFALPLALFSNVLTLNEIFIYTFSRDLIYAWCVLMLVIMVMEIHNYSFAETLRNIALTLFTMLMFLLTAYIFFVLFNQLVDFVQAIVQEVGLRG